MLRAPSSCFEYNISNMIPFVQLNKSLCILYDTPDEWRVVPNNSCVKYEIRLIRAYKILHMIRVCMYMYRERIAEILGVIVLIYTKYM